VKLRRWQKIVLSVIWLILVGIFAQMFAPDASQYENSRYDATKELIERESTLRVKMSDNAVIRNVPKGITKADLVDLYTDYFSQQTGVPEKEIDFASLIGSKRPAGELAEARKTEAQSLQIKYGKWIDFTDIQTKYRNDLKQLAAKRANIWIYAFLFWLGSLSVVYAFGKGWLPRTLLGTSKAKRQQEAAMQQETPYAYGGSPVLLAFEAGDGHWIAWCPFCAKFHRHHPGEGERPAHCGDFVDRRTGELLPDQSVFRDRGYVLRYAGKTTKEMRELARE
jgi:hypothetical protein